MRPHAGNRHVPVSRAAGGTRGFTDDDAGQMSSEMRPGEPCAYTGTAAGPHRAVLDRRRPAGPPGNTTPPAARRSGC